tara:strand:- start:2171 stop:2956 length:786 start_codon:yes stop_codon:yes gene_type:complete
MKNFILIYYEREKLTDFEVVNHRRYNKDKPKDFRLNIHRQMVTLSESRIHELYPKAEIHLITDKKYDFPGITEHVFEDMDREHTSKLLIYGLLDEPAMYLDSDVILVRPFDKEHLTDCAPINPYSLNHRGTFNWNKKKLPYYSASVIYIPEPSKQMQEDIIKVHTDEFLYVKGSKGAGSDKPHPLTSTNDEFSMSLFIHQNEWKPTLSKDVNVGRIRVNREGGFPRILTCQSVHYSGPKHLYEPELAKIRQHQSKKVAKFL